MQAIDISNYTGFVTPDMVTGWMGQGITHVVIACQFDGVFRQQHDVCVAGGMTVDAYRYVYFDQLVAPQIDQALQTIANSGSGYLWLDFEDVTPGLPSPADTVAIISVAVSRAQAGPFPVGIYTGAWWWVPRTGNSVQQAGLPLWDANWDGVADLTGFSPYGGWSAPAGKQYKAGQTYDYDVFVDRPIASDRLSLDARIRVLERDVLMIKAKLGI